MDTPWSNYCTMSIVHFMAFPETIWGDGPVVETVTSTCGRPLLRRNRDRVDQRSLRPVPGEAGD